MNSQRHFLTLVKIYTDFLSPFYDTSVLTLGRHGYPVVFCAAYPDECASCMRLVSFFSSDYFLKLSAKFAVRLELEVQNMPQCHFCSPVC